MEKLKKMESPILRIFISSVSDEFRTYRKALEKELNSSRVKIHDSSKVMIDDSSKVMIYDSSKAKVFEQEQLEYDGTQVLIQLKDIIKEYDVVFHLIGDRTGKPGNNGIPDKEQLQRLIESEPSLLETLGIDESELAEISYTHWEAILAIFYEKRLFVLIADNSVKRSSYLVDQDVIEFQKNLQVKHKERLERIGEKKGVRPEENQIFKGKLSLAKLALRKLCKCNLLPDSVLAPAITKRSLEKHVRELKTSTAGTELPLISLEARDNRPSLFKEILTWSVPRSIRRYDSSAQGDAEGNQIPKERMVHWCMTGKSTHILIVGEAGAGKSSYLRQLAYDVCQKWSWDDWSRRDWNQKCRLPVFLKWAEVLSTLKADLWKIVEGDSDEESIENIADRFFQLAATKISPKKDVTEWLCESATEHGMVFFLDALDEAAARLLSEKNRKSRNNSYATAEFFRLIGVLVERLATRNSIIISTTRSSALAFFSPSRLDYLPQVKESELQVETGIYTLAKWSMQDAKSYVDKVIGSYDIQAAATIKSSFKEEEEASSTCNAKTMGSLWKEPFLLSLYCNLFLEGRLDQKEITGDLCKLYESGMKYLASKSKSSSENNVRGLEAMIEIIGEFFLNVYFAKHTNDGFMWTLSHKQFDSIIEKTLKKIKNQSVVRALGANTEEVINRIKSTGFFKSVFDEKEPGIVHMDFVDYRLFEFMIARTIAMASFSRQVKLMDRVFSVGANPMILYHVATISKDHSALVWWIATRLSSISSLIREFRRPPFVSLPPIERESTQKALLFSAVLLEHPIVIKSVQSLTIERGAHKDESRKGSALLNHLISKIILQSNRNFLVVMDSVAKSFESLMPVRVANHLANLSVDGTRYEFHKLRIQKDPIKTRFCRAYLEANPKLFRSRIPKTVIDFDSTNSTRAFLNERLVRVKHEANECSINYYLVDEAHLMHKKGMESEDILGVESGSSIVDSIEEDFSTTFCGVILRCLCFKCGAVISLVSRLEPTQLKSELILLTFHIALRFLVVSAIIWAFILQGVIASFVCFLFLLVIWNLSSRVFAESRIFKTFISGSRFDKRQITFDLFNIMSQGKAIDVVDFLIQATDIAIVLRKYERHRKILQRTGIPGDMFVMTRQDIPYESRRFLRIIEKQNITETWGFSAQAIDLFAKGVKDEIHRENRLEDRFRLLQELLESKHRHKTIAALGKYFQVPSSFLESVLHKDSIDDDAYASWFEIPEVRTLFEWSKDSQSFLEGQFKKQLDNLPALEGYVEKAISGDTQELLNFIYRPHEFDGNPFSIWVSKHVEDGSIYRIVSALSTNFSLAFSKSLDEKSVYFDAESVLGFFIELGFPYLGDEVVELCCLFISKGIGMGNDRELRLLLILLSGIQIEIRVRNQVKLLAAIDGYTSYYERLGFYERYKERLRFAVADRSITHRLSFSRWLFRLFWFSMKRISVA